MLTQKQRNKNLKKQLTRVLDNKLAKYKNKEKKHPKN